MQVIDKGCRPFRGRLTEITVAAIFIIVGLLFLGKNLGIVEDSLFRIFISWQMFLIVIGLLSLSKRQVSSGMVLIGLGAFFLIPRITVAGDEWIKTYWPLVFVLAGLMLVVNLFFPERRRHSQAGIAQSTSYKTENGFVNSVNTFGSVKQIVLDPVFKGAKISNIFGGTVLDLRHTVLEAEQTFIDIECTFGGIEIFVPGSWNVEINTQNVGGGSDDKRFCSRDSIDNEHKLILRGKISFGGLEIKS